VSYRWLDITDRKRSEESAIPIPGSGTTNDAVIAIDNQDGHANVAAEVGTDPHLTRSPS
jgi:hypothetical protein